MFGIVSFSCAYLGLAGGREVRRYMRTKKATRIGLMFVREGGFVWQRRKGMDTTEAWSIPFANSSSPAVSSARVASLGRWSRMTDAAIVMGRVASASDSGSGGAEDGEGGDGEGEEDADAD